MPLGWIDYSRDERNKVLSVLELLSERGTLDELGVAPIRDGFANMFFPGTSTIQTRAKYFFIVPYACRDIEISGETSADKAIKALDKKERECGEKFRAIDPGMDGLIGGLTLQHGAWVKRPPSSIYWNGLRQYGIFNGDQTINEYFHAMCAIKRQKSTIEKLGNRRTDAEESEMDDRNAESIFKHRFWNMPTYSEDWFDRLDMRLAEDEGRFLKNQIERSCPDSMLGFILKNKLKEVKYIGSFLDLKQIISIMPEQMQMDYYMASDFARFIYVLQTVFTMAVTDDNNQKATDEWNDRKQELGSISDIDIDSTFSRLGIFANRGMRKFLYQAKDAMNDGNLNELKNIVKNREIFLKGPSRAKSNHPGEFDQDTWYGGDLLSYRFNDAKAIIIDIFESVGIC